MRSDRRTSNDDAAFPRERALWQGVAVLVALVLLLPLPVRGAAPQERHLIMIARSFAFEPRTVCVNRGDTVVIRLESSDVVYGLCVDGYGARTTAEPGRPGELRFVADRPGSYPMRCQVSCDNLHPFVIAKLVVGPNLAWRHGHGHA